MSNEAYVLSMMRKYKLAVCYFGMFVEAPSGYTVYFGPGEEFDTVERAVENVVRRLNP